MKVTDWRRESALARTVNDTLGGLKTVRFWVAQVFVGGIIGWVVSANPTPAEVPAGLVNGYPYISVFLGLATSALIVFLANYFKTPYRQRDEALVEGERREIELEAELERMNSELGSIRSAHPNIIFDQARGSQLYSGDGFHNPIFFVIQAWFKNTPAVHAEQSVAKDVTAILEFLNPGNYIPQFKLYGQWATSTAPDHVGHHGTQATIDIPPNYQRAKLQIALKWPADPVCYGYAAENFQGYPDGRHPAHELSIGEHPIRVNLEGVGVHNSYWFILTNRGPNEELELKPDAQVCRPGGSGVNKSPPAQTTPSP